MTCIYGTGPYVLWQLGIDDCYRYTNRRSAMMAARQSASSTSRSWVTDDRRPKSDDAVVVYCRGSSGRVYREAPKGSERRRKGPGRPPLGAAALSVICTIRLTPGEVAQQIAAAKRADLTWTEWMRQAAARALQG